jgi:NAD(P)-dependent dehydrogenase (short-subunit alcohol dehydrogenase family)
MGAFTDQVVWITGGGSGIGRGLALEFARQGADVAVSGRRAEALAAVTGEIEPLGRRGLAVSCDVADDAAVRAAVQAIVTHFGRLDVAVANAGMGVVGPFERLGDAEWHRQFAANVFGAVNTARHALPELRRTRGRLVLVSSVSGMLCSPGTSAYSASKFAVRALGLTLAQELHGSGVSCTTIYPGFVESDIARVDNQGRFDPRRPDKRPGLLLWPTDRAARVMVRAIHRRRLEFVFTGHGKLGAWLGRHCPRVVHLVMTRFGRNAAGSFAGGKM